MKQEFSADEAPARKPPAAKSPPAVPGESREEAVRRMAYLLYVERGCVDGCEVEDWLRAEVLVGQEPAAAAPGPDAPPAAAKRAPAKRAAAKPAPAVAAAPAPAAKRAPAKSRSK